MADSVINSPNSASAYFGLGAYHNMDLLISEQPIPFDADLKSYPFELNYFQPQYCYEPQYLLDDIHKLQIQLYQELRNQVVLQDLRKEPLLPDSASASTIDTPMLNTLMLLLLELAPTPDFAPDTPRRVVLDGASGPVGPVPARDPLPKPRMQQKPGDVAPKKHTRKHIMARLRNGCWICRIKHLKCDENRPVCKNCTRFGIQCDYTKDRPDYVLNKELRRVKLDAINTKKRRNGRPSESP